LILAQLLTLTGSTTCLEKSKGESVSSSMKMSGLYMLQTPSTRLADLFCSRCSQKEEKETGWNITLTARLTPNSTEAPLQRWWILNSWQLTNQHFLSTTLKILSVCVCVCSAWASRTAVKWFLQTSTQSSGTIQKSLVLESSQ